MTDYEIIEGNSWISLIPSSFGGLIKRAKSVGVVHDISSKKQDQWLGSSGFNDVVEGVLLKLPFNRVITVSRGVKNRLVKEHGLNPGKVV